MIETNILFLSWACIRNNILIFLKNRHYNQWDKMAKSQLIVCLIKSKLNIESQAKLDDLKP